jgi:hypothetical protein
MTRRGFVRSSAAAGLIGPDRGVAAVQGAARGVAAPGKLGPPAPRGSRRIVYVSDPSSIAMHYLPDPTTEEDLRDWVGELAAARVDTFVQEAYTQGWTTYWRGDRFEYDARPQHRRFLPLLDKGIQPLQVLVDACRRRGVEFLAGIRINDNHGHISVSQGVGAGARFLTGHPEWQLKDFPPGPYYRLSTPFDFTFPEVRDYIHAVCEDLVGRFDVDGLELCFRDHQYFPVGKGEERRGLMTDLVRRIRGLLEPRAGRRRRLLGARVYQTLDECRVQGLDVPGWIREGLLDYVSPGDVMHADFNAPYEEFTALTRATRCRLYPGVLPWTSIRQRRRGGGMPISAEQLRALARNLYGAGADGLSFYNHFTTIQWAPFYPMMLQDCADLRDPARLGQGGRHYVFEPIWAGSTGFGEGRTGTGALKADAIVLERGRTGASGRYRFRVCEDLAAARKACLVFRGAPWAARDRLAIKVNGRALPQRAARRRGDERRVDMAAPVDPASRASARLPPVPSLPQEVSTFWFTLASPPAVYGDNWLEITLAESDPAATRPLVIDEVEVFVGS